MWLDRLPYELKIALILSEHLSDEQLATIADRIYALQVINHRPQIYAQSFHAPGRDEEIEAHKKQLADLTLALQQSKQKQAPSSSVSQPQGRTRYKSRRHTSTSDLKAQKTSVDDTQNSKQQPLHCSYHLKYQA